MGKTTNFYPIRVEDYPDINNCLAFALGITIERPKSSKDYNLREDLPISEAFLNKCAEFGIEGVRQINSIEEATKEEYVICVFYHWTTFRNPFYTEPIPYREFHVIRRELNGNWVHKDWDSRPSIISKEEMIAIRREFPNPVAIFALKTED